MGLHCTIRELQCIQYFKSAFLEMLNVPIRSVFVNPITYVITYAVKRVIFTRCKFLLILQEWSCLMKIFTSQFSIDWYQIFKFNFLRKDGVEASLPGPRDPSNKVILPSTIVAT